LYGLQGGRLLTQAVSVLSCIWRTNRNLDTLEKPRQRDGELAATQWWHGRRARQP
jgi:hypothetical protein